MQVHEAPDTSSSGPDSSSTEEAEPEAGTHALVSAPEPEPESDPWIVEEHEKERPSRTATASGSVTHIPMKDMLQVLARSGCVGVIQLIKPLRQL